MTSFQDEIKSEWPAVRELLAEFVRNACLTRDASHGFEHMKETAELAAKFAQGSSDTVTLLVLIVAWLHDVADRKYDRDGALKKRVRVFLAETIYPLAAPVLAVGLMPVENPAGFFSEWVIQTIDAVSFSWETMIRDRHDPRLTGLEFQHFLTNTLNPIGCMVRNFVSDADKCLALQKDVGVMRTSHYTSVKAEEKGEKIDAFTVYARVIQHCDDKLIRMYPEGYFWSTRGQVYAKQCQKEFVEDLIASFRAAVAPLLWIAVAP